MPSRGDSESGSGGGMSSQRSGSGDPEVVRQFEGRLQKLEAESEVLQKRIETSESNGRATIAELRGEIPGLITGEVGKHIGATTDAVNEAVSRVTRLETDFTRERERWSTIVTSFDHRLDHRLRSFRQDVTVMLAGISVLVLAMLLLLLMRR